MLLTFGNKTQKEILELVSLYGVNETKANKYKIWYIDTDVDSFNLHKSVVAWLYNNDYIEKKHIFRKHIKYVLTSRGLKLLRSEQ